jgi:MFS family permease
VSVEPAPTGAKSQLVALAVATILGMTPWFSATVAAPGMIAEWGIGQATTSWLTIAVQLGFVVGTCISAALMLSDRFSARRLAAVSALVTGVATLLLARRGTGPNEAIALRLITGIALAGVYPPGIKIVAGWWRERRGTAIGILVGALTIGSAAPNLFRLGLDVTQWRSIVVAAAVGAVLSSMLFAFVVREGPFQAPSSAFDPRAVLTVLGDRGVLLATGGYLGHMWELYAMWSSIGLFWAYVATRGSVTSSMATLLAFLTIAAGTVGCVIAGVAGDRVGRPLVTIVAMAISGTCAVVIGTLVSAPIVLLVAVAVVWGMSIVADSAQFSASVTELAPGRYVGTAITVQTCLGFLLTIVTIRLVPVWANWWGWERAFIPLAVGPALGILAMWRLQRSSRVDQQSPSAPH